MGDSDKFRDIDVTQDELHRIKKALQNEEFRKLFTDYAKEISDPKNKELYEKEITQLENERGMDIQFVHPDPGYVIKTNILENSKKVFINVCKSPHIKNASCERKTNTNGESGLQWSIPHSFSPPQEDFDKMKNPCNVYDFVVHPDTYRLAETNNRFKNVLHDTAFDGIEKTFGIKINRSSIKFPKLNFKGTRKSTVIRTRKENKDEVKQPSDKDDFLKKFPYPYDDKTSAEKTKIAQKEVENKSKLEKNSVSDKKSVTPKFSITHRSNVKIEDFQQVSNKHGNTRPDEIVVKVSLPLIKSANQVNLDVFEKKLILSSESPSNYHLDLELPYLVDENSGSAKFDKNKKHIVITLKVIKPLETNNIHKNNENNSDNQLNDSSNEEKSSSEQANCIDTFSEHNCNDKSKNTTVESNEGINDCKINSPSIETKISSSTESSDILSDTKCDASFVNIPKIIYNLPNFSHSKLETSVIFILSASNVTKHSIVTTFPDSSHGFLIQFSSIGAGGFPTHYSFSVRFHEDYTCTADKTKIIIQDSSLVLNFIEFNQVNDDRFWYGLDYDHLEEGFFITEESLDRKMKILEKKNKSESSFKSETKNALLNVTEMSEDLLTIKIKPSEKNCTATISQKAQSKLISETDNTKSALHGILKSQNSLIDSSGDERNSVSSPPSTPGSGSVTSFLTSSNSNCAQQGSRTSLDSYGSCRYESEPDLDVVPQSPDCGSRPVRKKSVSFSEYVDQTTYRCGQTVKAMKDVLRNKRKRAKRKEEKQANSRIARHRRTSGSELSSDDQLSGHSINTTTEEEEDSGEDEVIDHFSSKLPSAGLPKKTFGDKESDSHDESDPVAGFYSQSTSHDEDEENALNSEKPEIGTKTSRQRRRRNRRRKGASTLEPVLAASNNTQCGSDVSSPEPVVSGDGLSSKNLKGDVKKLPNTADNDSLLERDLQSKNLEPSSNKNNVLKNTSDSSVNVPDELIKKENGKALTDKHNNASNTKLTNGESKTSTLNWEDPITADTDHKTKCAFEFSNSVMYELDEE